MKVLASFIGILLAILHCASGVDYIHTIYINPATGEDSPECLTTNSPSSPCANLTWVLQQSRQDSTNYVLSQGTHTLTEDTPQFKDLKHLAFTGNGSLVNCIDTGLAFINVEDIVFHAIAFSGCAALRNSTSKSFAEDNITEFMVGLYFYLCESITMTAVSVSHSPNATGVVIYNTNGTNTFSDSNFTDNRVAEGHVGGGGIQVEFTYCPPDILSCDMPNSERNEGASFTFTSCEFSKNYAHISTVYLSLKAMKRLSIGSGGGLAYSLRGNASGNTLTVENCLFHSNQATWGGGLVVNLMDTTHSNTITITNSDFVNNSNPLDLSSTSGREGGGIRLTHYVNGLNTTSAKRNELTIERCNFINNTANYGAGISLSWSLQQSSLELAALIRVCDSHFEGNVAKIGAAIHVNRFRRIRQGYKLSVWIENCSFNSNNIFNQISKGIPFELGIGIVYLTSTDVSFMNTANFTNNYGSALAVNSGSVSFIGPSSFTFYNNSANKGGAIALLSSSSIILTSDTRMLFKENHANIKGGAIYASLTTRQNLESDDNCFVKYADMDSHPDDWNVTVTFIKNHVNVMNVYNSIFATSVLPCMNPTLSNFAGDDNGVFCWQGWNYYDSTNEGPVNCSTQISSEVGDIDYDGIEDNHVHAFPGWEFEIPVVAYDDLDHNINDRAVFDKYLSNSSSLVYGDTTSIEGSENEEIKMILETTGERVWYAEVFVYLNQCPPGFKEENNSCICASTYSGIVYCNLKAQDAKLTRGYWMGLYPNTTTYYVSLCAYCKQNQNAGRLITLPSSSEELDALLCSHNHAGFLCGECIQDYGLAVNTDNIECVNCTDINLAKNIAIYAVAVYVPQILLFVILIFFDIRLTSGPAISYILFAQLVNNFSLDLDGVIPLDQLTKHTDILSAAYTIPYGIFSLEFLEKFLPPLCFSPSLNALTILCLQYCVAFFPAIIISVVLLLLKIKDCCKSVLHVRLPSYGRCIGEAILPAFASFLLLSYTKFTIVSLSIVFTTPLIDEYGTVHNDKRYAYFAGQYSLSDSGYKFPYLAIAIIVLCTFVAIPPLIVLDYPLRGLEWIISKSPRLRRIYPSIKVHIFLDTFQGCYKDNMRCFAGLYYLFRLIIIAARTIFPTLLERLIVQQIACSVLLVLLALCQPYKEKYINYVDILMVADLTILTSLGIYLLEAYRASEELQPPYFIFSLQIILIFLPLVYAIGFLLKLYAVKWLQKCAKKWIIKRKWGWKKVGQLDTCDARNLPHVTDSAKASAGPQDETEALFTRAEDANRYKPSAKKATTSVVGLNRESYYGGSRGSINAAPGYGTAHSS